MDIGSQTDKTESFDNYKTYAWVRRNKSHKHADARVDNDIVEGRIIKFSNIEMHKRGLILDTLKPDLLLDYDILTEKRAEEADKPLSSGSYYYSQPYVGLYSPYYVWPPQTFDYGAAKSTYQNGTVILFVADREKNKLVYQAWADGSVEDIRGFEEDLPKSIKSMYKHFPLKRRQ